MKVLGRLLFGLVVAIALVNFAVHGSIWGSVALLFVGLAALDSFTAAMLGCHVLGNVGWGGGWGGRMAPNRNDVVGWGLSNLLAIPGDVASAAGQLLTHPSLGNLAHLGASPFEGLAQTFGIGTPGSGWIGQNPVGANGVPAYGSTGGALPAPVPALGAGMTQAHAGHMNPRAIVSYMGLGTTNWVGTDATVKTLNPEPQAPFIGNRLVLVQNRSAGAVGRQVVISSPLTVSGVPQTPAPNVPAPVEMFAQDATYSALQIQIAAAGTAISISFAIDAAPGGTDFVNLSAGMYGYWLR